MAIGFVSLPLLERLCRVLWTCLMPYTSCTECVAEEARRAAWRLSVAVSLTFSGEALVWNSLCTAAETLLVLQASASYRSLGRCTRLGVLMQHGHAPVPAVYLLRQLAAVLKLTLQLLSTRSQHGPEQ